MTTAEEYIEWVLSSDDPHSHSTGDKEFKVLPAIEQQKVVKAFDGYGLQHAVESRKRTP